MYNGILEVKAINDIMRDMAEQPNPASLFDNLWYEGELACLFADSNVGKSIFAVQIAETIAVQQPVLFIDCELTNKQFQMRYTNPDTGSHHSFPGLFYRATIASERIGMKDFEESLLQSIEEAAIVNKCKVIILDNLTYACNTSEKGDAAGLFMMNLKRLQMNYGWSLLIIAHTPKRDEGEKIVAGHLAGSKKLFNFFDCVFALGKSKEDDSFRYFKQLKVRSGEFVYTEDNVAVYELEKYDDGALYFTFRKQDKEQNQLNSSFDEDYEFFKKIIELRNSNKSFREIANGLGISKSRAHRIHQRFINHTNQGMPMDGDEVFIPINECPVVPNHRE